MNNQFATQFLREEVDSLNWLRDALFDLRADAQVVAIFVKAVELKHLTPEQAIQITKETVGLSEDGAPAGGITSSVGGNSTNGAAWTSGAGEQMTGRKKAFKEDVQRLAAGKASIKPYTKDGFTKAPSAEAAAKDIKGVQVKSLWEEPLNEANRYSQFKKEAATRSKPEQMHQAAKIIHSKLEEITRLLEFTKQMRSELAEGDDNLEYKHNTKKVFEKINSKVVEVYSKVKSIS